MYDTKMEVNFHGGSKQMRTIGIITLISIISLFIFIPNAFAASTSVSSSFDASEYYQGKAGAVDVWVTNTGQDYILVETVWITFDWMGGSGYKLDKTSTPIRIDAGSKVNIGKISFGIESSASIGFHTYQWLISGQENKIDFWGKPYLSPFNTGLFGSSQISVETPLKPEAETALNTALNDINNARSKNFESTDAINKVNQATTDYNSGINAKNGRDFSSAINYANSAKKLIADSYILEQTYKTNKANAENARNNAVKALNSVGSPESVDAKNKLSEANSHFSIAETRISSKDFNSAVSEYNIAKSLAEQVPNLEREYQDKKEARRIAKQNAENAIVTAKSKINNIIDLRSDQAKNMLNDARSHLNTAENHLSSGNYDAAINEAKIAGDYADNALKTEEKWRNENPVKSAVKTSGFQFIYAILGITLIALLLRKRSIH